MERAFLRLLRTSAVRASRASGSSRPRFLQPGLLRGAEQGVRCYVSITDGSLSGAELRSLRSSTSRAIWECCRRFASDAGPGEVVVPFMGDLVPDGNLAAILKQPGDSVEADEVIAQTETDKVPVTRLRERVATRLKDSQNTFALLTTFNEIDMTNLMGLRAQYKDAFQEKQAVKLGFMSGFVKNLGNGGDYQGFLPVSTVRSVRGYNQYPFAASGIVNTAGNQLLGAQQVRTIMVEVKRNDLDRAIRRWRRKCKEENLRVLKDREYYIKPSEKKVLARKERDRRIAKKAFKQKLNWIMSRRQRGF